ncbi:MAG: hypothetical protein QGG39_13830 [Candidatus Poribacteria bacterium]|nr:hypothetical protein [Candidatus Poribacteria bacterium]
MVLVVLPVPRYVTVTNSTGEKLTFADLNTVVLTVSTLALENGVAATSISSITANGTYTFTDDGSTTVSNLPDLIVLNTR